MRYVLAAFGLLLLGACAQPMQTADNALTRNDNRVKDLNRFVEPTGGAAYSESDLYYWIGNANRSVGGAAQFHK